MKQKIFIYIIIMLLYSCSAMAQSKEYTLKAAFIEKFGRFTQWPANSNQTQFIIAVIGQNPFDNILNDMARQTKIQGKSTVVKYITNYNDAVDCQILFIAQSETRNTDKILAFTASKPILVVSDISGLAKKGAHFSFYTATDEKLHFECNPKAIKQSGLETDMYIISVAKVIDNP